MDEQELQELLMEVYQEEYEFAKKHSNDFLKITILLYFFCLSDIIYPLPSLAVVFSDTLLFFSGIIFLVLKYVQKNAEEDIESLKQKMKS